jgi:hypothetical protein
MSELEILDLVRASARADGSEARPSSRHGGNSPIGTADPSISADGTKVAFTSDFLDLVPNDTNGNSDIFVRDLTTGAIERANTTADGAPSETGSPLLEPVLKGRHWARTPPLAARIASMKVCEEGQLAVYRGDLTAEFICLVATEAYQRWCM